MQLREIKLRNFLSHERTDLGFSPGESLLIDGVSGSGKSSVCEALVWCLYGKGRLDNRSLVRRGADSCSVTVVLEHDGTEYSVVRKVGKSGTQRLAVEVDGRPAPVSGVREVQEFVEREITGASYLLFVNSAVHMQDGRESFVRQSSKTRKDLIMELAGAFDLERWYARVKAAADGMRADVARLEGEMATLEEAATEEVSDGDPAGELAELLPKVERMRAEAAKRRETEEEARGLKIQYEVHTKHMSDLRRDLERTEAERRTLVAKMEKTLSGQDSAVRRKAGEGIEEDMTELGLKEAAAEAAAKWDSAWTALLARRPPASNEAWREEQLNAKLISLMTEDVRECPDTGRECSLVREARDREADSLKESLETVKGDRERAARLEKEWLTGVDAIGARPNAPTTEEITELKSRILAKEVALAEADRLDEERERTAAEIRDRTAALDKRLEETKASLDDTAELRRAATERYTVLATALKDPFDPSELAEAEELKSRLEAAAAVAEDRKRRIDESKKRLDRKKKEAIRLRERSSTVERLKEAFGTNGIRAIVAEMTVPALEERANDILGRMSDFTIRLDTQREGVGKDSVLDGLFVSVTNGDGEEFDFDGYSGGERLKITVAISEALAEMGKADFRVLDEVFVGLDDESTERFAAVMGELGGRFSQLVCVSHLRSIKDLFHRKVTAVKTDGVTRLT